MDAREDWLDLVREGTPPAEASHRVISAFSGDEQDSSTATLAVASIAWKHGRLDTNTKLLALEIIKSGTDLGRWAEAGQGQISRRRATLDRLRSQLEAPPPAPSRLGPRPQRRPEFPAGSVIEVDLGATRICFCRVYHHSTKAGPFCTIEPLAWTEARAPSVSEMKSLAPVAVEGGVPTVSGSSIPQQVGPHRCLLILRRAERQDPRLTVIARDVFNDNAVDRSAAHGSMTVDAWIRHLNELYRTEH